MNDLNLELSVTLTTLCTIAAFGFMPAYLGAVFVAKIVKSFSQNF